MEYSGKDFGRDFNALTCDQFEKCIVIRAMIIFNMWSFVLDGINHV